MMTAEELKAIPIEPRINLHNASYKNPGRLLIRSDARLGGYRVYFGVNGKVWDIGDIRDSKRVDENDVPVQESALVYRGGKWARVPWDGRGQEPIGGPNLTLAVMSHKQASYSEIRNADKVMVCIVHPNKTHRSMCYYFENDIYDTRQDSGYGTPKKTRRSVPRAKDRCIWPADWKEEEEEETMDFTKPPGYNDIRVAHPGTKSVLTWPLVTQTVPNVVRVDADKQIFHAEWPRLSEVEFPYVLRNGDPEYIGVIWMVLPNYATKSWEAAPTEQLHQERERNRTFWTYEHILDDGQYIPRKGDVFGLFIAGPSRHEEDKPEYRRRTPISWWVMGDGLLSRYFVQEPPPEDNLAAKALARAIMDQKEILRLLDSNAAMQDLIRKMK